MIKIYEKESFKEVKMTIIEKNYERDVRDKANEKLPSSVTWEEASFEWWEYRQYIC